ncbi:hypothetical protein HOO65_070069 [Ceratocystis lukuohia]|uniref:Uncharacterized protein n=1 Tax=Ceratocystis lukuohia TaxID=2019550 RepID=A0ABR4MBH0_9PEZI
MAAIQSTENGLPSNTAYGTTTAAWRNCLARLPPLVLKAALAYLKDILVLLAIYAVSQFLIWLFAVCLQSHGLQYLSPIVSMVSLLAACILLAWIFPALDAWYVYTLQSRVETLNENIGIGFAIPLLQITSGKFMGVSQLARAVAAFFLTNAVFWPLLFSISYALLAISACQAVQTAKQRFKPVSDAGSTPQAVNSCSKAGAPDARLVPFFHAMLLLALFSAGIAVRRLSLFILDLSAVLLLWLIATSVQRAIPKGHIMLRALANPVLGTTLGLMLYTHLVATATHVRIDTAVSAFNSGVTPADFLSKLLGISTAKSPATPGAGDLAKSILDVGIVIWGFKLYECRTALFSLRGFLTLVVAAVAAVVNMVLAPMLARATRLSTAKALAFTARWEI